MKSAAAPLLALLASLAMASFARADVEILFRDGGRTVVDSYQVRGQKLLVYQSSGVLEIDRSRVESLRDLGEDDRAPASPATKAGAVSPAAAAPSSPPAILVEDTSARERELTKQIILANRDLLFAQNRGDDEASIEKRKKDLAKLESERSTLGKQTKAH